MTAQDITQRLLDTAGVEWDGDRRYLGMSRLWMCPRKLFFEMKEGQPKPNAAAMLRCHEGYLHERDVLSRLKSAGIHLQDEGKEIRGIRSRVKGHLDAIIAVDRFLNLKKNFPGPNTTSITATNQNNTLQKPVLHTMTPHTKYSPYPNPQTPAPKHTSIHNMHAHHAWTPCMDTIGVPQFAIVEIKSLLCFQEPFTPRHKDITQVQAYMHFHPSITQSILIYKSRTSGEIKVFTIPYDPETGSRLERKARSILQAIDDDLPPSCECGRCPDERTNNHRPIRYPTTEE